MSLLRQRAIAVSFESTLRGLRPAAARAWFVRRTRVASEVELKLLTLQASVVRGAASNPADDRRNAIAVIAANRRGSARKEARRPRVGRRAADWTVIGSEVSCGHRLGIRCAFDPRPAEWCKPPCEGPGRTGHGYQHVLVTVTHRPGPPSTNRLDS